MNIELKEIYQQSRENPFGMSNAWYLIFIKDVLSKYRDIMGIWYDCWIREKIQKETTTWFLINEINSEKKSQKTERNSIISDKQAITEMKHVLKHWSTKIESILQQKAKIEKFEEDYTIRGGFLNGKNSDRKWYNIRIVVESFMSVVFIAEFEPFYGEKEIKIIKEKTIKKAVALMPYYISEFCERFNN